MIKTKRLLLRPLCMDDINTVHAYASNLDNTKYMLFLPNETVDESKEFLRFVTLEWQKDLPSTYEFAIVLDNIHIGAISISLDDTRQQGEIGWILHKDYWNLGYTTEVAIAVLDFAKNHLGLPSVIAHCDHRNLASIKVMEKIGMKLIDHQGTRTYLKRNETAKELTYRIVF